MGLAIRAGEDRLGLGNGLYLTLVSEQEMELLDRFRGQAREEQAVAAGEKVEWGVNEGFEMAAPPQSPPDGGDSSPARGALGLTVRKEERHSEQVGTPAWGSVSVPEGKRIAAPVFTAVGDDSSGDTQPVSFDSTARGHDAAPRMAAEPLEHRLRRDSRRYDSGFYWY